MDLPDEIETRLPVVAGSLLSTTDSDLPEGTGTYKYHVTATGSAQQVSELSDPACVTVTEETVAAATCP
ncbi:MAG: hypothetical protein M3353_05555 [Actinomycetota bacterium]|nr:hypothetical protein [Actinomycetota bacterium]